MMSSKYWPEANAQLRIMSYAAIASLVRLCACSQRGGRSQEKVPVQNGHCETVSTENGRSFFQRQVPGGMTCDTIASPPGSGLRAPSGRAAWV